MKSKYLLYFNISEDKIKFLIRDPEHMSQFNEKIIKAIMKIYNLKIEKIFLYN